MSHVDVIIHQWPWELVNLQCSSIITTFQKKCDMVSIACANRHAKAELEVAAVASYQIQDAAEADAYIAAKTTFNTELQEMVAAHKAEDTPGANNIYNWDYNSEMDQCGCYSEFGKNDDGEVNHGECKYSSCL